ncbi:type I restriction-modification system subunit M [uncultured Turicimonas sp.]|uniref:type I restriction-modification system subunit M n=1 Tax=uncultured Turicimonas sp. TaxID=1918607 RepID=UPI0028055FE0|nr:type I restriction-modification system subunit M [uncultured Turicimonas sp.]
MNKKELANTIWASADHLRSKIDASKYKDIILGFLFYKFLSHREVQYLMDMSFGEVPDLKTELEKPAVIADIKQSLGFYIPYKHLYSTWVQNSSELEFSQIQDAFNDFEGNIFSASDSNDESDVALEKSMKDLFGGIFSAMISNLAELGENGATRKKTARNLIELLDLIPLDGQRSYDVLGFIYEYLIGQFAATGGKKAGEFYTPHEVSVLMSEIVAHHLQDKQNIRIYDPTSGSASLLLNIGNSIAKLTGDRDSIEYFAQELNSTTYNLTRMNLIMRGIAATNIHTRNADTLLEDWPIDSKDSNAPLRVNACISNPPYSAHWSTEGMEMDVRFSDYGVAPATKADFAFLLHNLYHLTDDGIMAIVLPHGVLFRGEAEEKIRTKLVETNVIDTIIGLPPNIFFGTGIPTIVMILKKGREERDILFVDASKTFVKEGNKNQLRARDVKLIADVVNGRGEKEGFSRKVALEEVKSNGFNLNIPRYIASEQEHPLDLYATIFSTIPARDIEQFAVYWKQFPSLKTALFENIGNDNMKVKAASVKDVIFENSEVTKFLEEFSNSVSAFSEFLDQTIISDEKESLDVDQTETLISNQLFEIFNSEPLVDPYAVYQIFINHWEKISMDLETIQSDTSSLRGCNGEDGRIIPFSLIQKNFKDLQNILQQISTKKEELDSLAQETLSKLEDLTEEQVSSCPAINEDKTSFISSKEARAFLKSFSDEEKLLDPVCIAVQFYIDNNKKIAKVKKEIKELEEKLWKETKETLEKLTSDEINGLLREKWIDPLKAELQKAAHTELENLEFQIGKLEAQYNKNSWIETEQQLRETTSQLLDLFEQLTGPQREMEAIAEVIRLLKGECYGNENP